MQVIKNYEALSTFKGMRYTVHRTAFRHEGPGRVTGFVECSLQDEEKKVNVKGVFIYETQDKLLRKASPPCLTFESYKITSWITGFLHISRHLFYTTGGGGLLVANALMCV
jgi:hypothetical protein